MVWIQSLPRLLDHLNLKGAGLLQRCRSRSTSRKIIVNKSGPGPHWGRHYQRWTERLCRQGMGLSEDSDVGTATNPLSEVIPARLDVSPGNDDSKTWWTATAQIPQPAHRACRSVESVCEQERGRIALEVHDVLGQALGDGAPSHYWASWAAVDCRGGSGGRIAGLEGTPRTSVRCRDHRSIRAVSWSLRSPLPMSPRVAAATSHSHVRWSRRWDRLAGDDWGSRRVST